MKKKQAEALEDKSDYADVKESPSESLFIHRNKSEIQADIESSYTSAMTAYAAEDFKVAEQEFIRVIKPVLSKPLMRAMNITDVDDTVKAKLLDAMFSLSNIYLQDNIYFNNYAKAAAIFQYCANFAKTYNIGDPEKYLSSAYATEKQLLASISGGEYTDLSKNEYHDYEKQIDKYQSELAGIRENVGKRLGEISNLGIEQITDRANAVEQIYKDSTGFFVNPENQDKGFLQSLIASCIDQLGSPPEGCEYTVIGFGSLAGGKMTPWSDLEFGILINEDNETYKGYFRNLTKLLHIKVINMGETQLSRVGIESLNNYSTGEEQDEWFWDDITVRGFRFDAACWDGCKIPFGRHGEYKVKIKRKGENEIEEEITEPKPPYELIADYKILAKLQEAEGDETHTGWKTDKYLIQALRSVSLIYGSQKLLNEYRDLVKHGPDFKDKALELLAQDTEKFSLKLGEEEEGKLINVKKDIYRIGDRVIEALADYYGIAAEEGQSHLTAWDKIEEMQKRGILGSEGAQHLKEALSISTELRLRTYANNESQEDTMSTYEPAVEHLSEEQKTELREKTFYFKDTAILHHFYYVMLRVQELVKAFCEEGYSEDLGKDQLFKDDYHTKGLAHCRFLEYGHALTYLEKAAEQDSENFHLLDDLYSLNGKLGKIDDAIEIAEKMLALALSEFGNTYDPHVAAIYAMLGVAYTDKGEYDKAIEYHKLDLEICKSSCNRLDIVRSYNNIGLAYHRKGEYDKAIEYHKLDLEIWQEVYKSNLSHTHIAKCYNNLGSIYSDKGEYDQAIEYHELALRIEQEIYKSNPNHPGVASSCNNLGVAYAHKGEYDKAIEYHKLAFKIRQSFYKSNPNHPDVAIDYDNLGLSYSDIGEYDKAIKYHKFALEMFKKVYKSNFNKPDVGICYNNIGLTYHRKGNHDKAMEYYELALNMFKEIYKSNSNHPDVVKSYNGIQHSYKVKQVYKNVMMELNKGKAALCKGKEKQAQKYFASATKLLSAFECTPLKLAELYSNIGDAYMLTQPQKDYGKKKQTSQTKKCITIKNQAIEYYEEAQKIFKKLHKTIKVYEKLKHIYVMLENERGIKYCETKIQELQDFKKAQNMFKEEGNDTKAHSELINLVATLEQPYPEAKVNEVTQIGKHIDFSQDSEY